MVVIANTYCAINPAFTSISNEESSWLHQPHKPRLKITHLNFLKASLLEKSPCRFKTLLKVSNGKAGRCHWWSASCTSLWRIYPSDDIGKINPRRLSINLSRHRLEKDHGWKLRQVSFFCSSFYSCHLRDMQNCSYESNFSLPRLRPIHREVVNGLQKTQRADLLFNLQRSKADRGSCRFKKGIAALIAPNKPFDSTHEEPSQKGTNTDTFKKLSPSESISIELKHSHHQIQNLFVLTHEKRTISCVELLNLLKFDLAELCHCPYVN